MGARSTTRERWRALLKLLAALAVFEAVYLFIVFGGSDRFSSPFRWIVGFYLQFLGVAWFLAYWWRLRVKARRLQSAERTAGGR